MKYQAKIDERTFEVEITGDSDALTIKLDGQPLAVDVRRIDGDTVYSLLVDGHSYEGFVHQAEGQWQVTLQGQPFAVEVKDERAARLAQFAAKAQGPSGETSIKAPMPGMVVAVHVGEGDEVTKGTSLVVLEAMKMQNELGAPRDGVVKAVRVAAGQAVEQNAVLVVLAAQAETEIEVEDE